MLHPDPRSMCFCFDVPFSQSPPLCLHFRRLSSAEMLTTLSVLHVSQCKYHHCEALDLCIINVARTDAIASQLVERDWIDCKPRLTFSSSSPSLMCLVVLTTTLSLPLSSAHPLLSSLSAPSFSQLSAPSFSQLLTYTGRLGRQASSSPRP